MILMTMILFDQLIVLLNKSENNQKYEKKKFQQFYQYQQNEQLLPITSNNWTNNRGYNSHSMTWPQPVYKVLHPAPVLLKMFIFNQK